MFPGIALRAQPGLCRLLAESLFERRHHADECAIDQRLRLDKSGTIVAETVGELVGGERHRLLALPVGEKIRAPQRADPRQLGERELTAFAFELDPHPALERRREFGEM